MDAQLTIARTLGETGPHSVMVDSPASRDHYLSRMGPACWVIVELLADALADTDQVTIDVAKFWKRCGLPTPSKTRSALERLHRFGILHLCTDREAVFGMHVRVGGSRDSRRSVA